jgi:hypothetical protein
MSVKSAFLPADFNPRFASIDQVLVYTGLSRSEVERRLRDGTYESFLISPQKRMIVFSTVTADAERRRGQGSRLGEHVGEGRGGAHKRKGDAARTAERSPRRKAKDAAATAPAGE